MRRCRFTAAMMAVVLYTDVAPVFAEGGKEPARDPIRVGMVRSLFKDAPKSTIDWLTKPFAKLLKDHAGLDGTLEIGGDCFHLGKMLDEKKLHLGAFAGFQFAWAQKNFPDLEPIVTTVHKHGPLRAVIVVLKTNSAAGLADLRNKVLAEPLNTMGHCRLFLERSCRAAGAADPKTFFSRMTRPPSAIAALDEIVNEKIDAALVDSELLQSYEQLKPGNFSWLKLVAKSEVFPPGVLACRKGALNERTLAKIREGMTKAHQTASGSDLLAMFKITAFELPPSNLSEMLADIVKAYPAPAPKLAVRAAR